MYSPITDSEFEQALSRVWVFDLDETLWTVGRDRVNQVKNNADNMPLAATV